MRRKTAQILFDSEAAVARFGTRAAGSHPRTLIFQADLLCIDVLVEEGADGLRIIHGQVAHAFHGRPMPGVRVQAGAETIETDEHGQFCTVSRRVGDEDTFLVYTSEIAVICSIPSLEPALG